MARKYMASILCKIDLILTKPAAKTHASPTCRTAMSAALKCSKNAPSYSILSRAANLSRDQNSGVRPNPGAGHYRRARHAMSSRQELSTQQAL